MKTVYDVPAQEFNEATKEALKSVKEIKPPEWALYAKSGAQADKPPVQDDFWYIRSASILKKLSTKGSIGVSRLRTEYGGRKNRGVKPGEMRKAGGKMIRLMLQQLEAAGLVAKDKKKGRAVTAKGQKFLDGIAKNVVKKAKKPKVYKESKAAQVEQPKKESKEAKPAVEFVKNKK